MKQTPIYDLDHLGQIARQHGTGKWCHRMSSCDRWEVTLGREVRKRDMIAYLKRQYKNSQE